MNLEELKGAWIAQQEKMSPVSPLNPDVIRGMISKRSETMTSKIRKFYVNGILFCSFYVVVSCLLGWSSDHGELFNQRVMIRLGALFLALFVLGLAWLRMRKIDHEQNVLHHLEEMVSHYVLAMRTVVVLVVLALGTFLIVLPSLKLSENIASQGLVWGILDTYEMLVILAFIMCLGQFFLQKLRWSKVGGHYSLKQVKQELKALRELTAELREDQV
ncbi:hypothetical protein [Pedobacter polysacchareus]|uniref:hypothetical protein n=1 Tax=Pedobacter polysacchareus TaxID=2861973 RepID=UPI001C99A7B6|nr:hypothetical protein [Pedobacter polysacchareus]